MKIGKGSVVGMEYSLHLGDGKVVDASSPDKPLSYLHGEGQIVPGLERALEGMDIGESKHVVVAPEDGYGRHDPAGVQEVPLKAFPPDVTPEVGMQGTALGPQGENVPFEIKELKPDTAVIDLNHPLAGQTLHFDVTVRDIRAATVEELEHGHAHGPGHEH